MQAQGTAARMPVLSVWSNPGAMIDIHIDGQGWLEKRTSRTSGILSIQLPKITTQGWHEIQVDVLNEEEEEDAQGGVDMARRSSVWIYFGAESHPQDDDDVHAVRILHPLTGAFSSHTQIYARIHA